MLTRRLLFRIAWPSLVASLLFLTSCAAAAVFLGMRQAATVRELEIDLDGRRIVDALLKDLSELIEIGLHGDGSEAGGSRVAELNEDVRRLLAESDAAANRPAEVGIVDRLESGFRRYREAVEAGGDVASAGAPGRAALAILETEVRQAARELDSEVAESTARSLAAMHRTASWTAWWLAGVGVLATIAGLFFGYSVATGLERAMIRAEELAAVGRMAAGMAHELRNPLTAISMLVQLQREKAEEEGLPAEDLQVIEREIVRMEERLNAFIDYARPPRPKWRTIDPVAVVVETLALLQGRAAKHRVEMRLVRPGSPITVQADAEQIGRVLMNLAMNALDAMPRGGRLTTALTTAPDGFVELTVDDTGPGVEPDALPRLFEPFFTSKDAGLGLGLAISERIARDHGGSLVASNRPEGGARFVLRLPGPSRIVGHGA
ncbi:sensor histidine kinase [Paludisphaera soli]|uniref:sensor histidine kinase n=1 Tax=Paludisphaera soli TaxID=2712865 RepID=UPI001F0D1E7F|nr:ATP-binding protein [Paludisphaera soli]